MSYSQTFPSGTRSLNFFFFQAPLTVQVAIRCHPFTVIIQPATLPVLRNYKKKKLLCGFQSISSCDLDGFSFEARFKCALFSRDITRGHAGSRSGSANLLTSPRQVLTGLTPTTVSNHHHNTTLTHFLTGVNQPTRRPRSHFGDLGCWEDEVWTCDLGLTTMTAGISKKPQPVSLAIWSETYFVYSAEITDYDLNKNCACEAQM